MLSGFLIKFHSMRTSLQKLSDAADHKGYIQYLSSFLEDPADTAHGGQTEVWPKMICAVSDDSGCSLGALGCIP